MNAVQVHQPSTSATNLSSTDKLLHDLVSIFDDDRWPDIQVKVQDKSFSCHKNILAARSSYFKERLGRDRNLNKIVEGGNSNAFELVRRYIYTGTVAIDQADEELITNVLSLSVKYKLDELTNFVNSQIRKRLTTGNAVNVFRLMSDVKMNSIAEECLKFIRVHGDDCLQGESYIELNLNQLVRLLKNVSLSLGIQFTLIRQWSKKHRDVNATRLFEMLDGESDGNIGQLGTGGKQYILLKGDNGDMAILDAATFDRVLTRHEPTTKDCQIAVCNGILYTIDTRRGKINSTPVTGLLNRESIQWDKCTTFESSGWIPGNAAVSGSTIYFMDRARLLKFCTESKGKKAIEMGGLFTCLTELNGLIYCYKDNRFQFTDGINGWTQIVPPTSIGKYSYHCSLVKIRDTICLVGGQRNGYMSRVLCYNTTTSYWTKGKSINQARCSAGAVSLNEGRALIIGGHDGHQWMETIELFDEQTKKWTLIDYEVKLKSPQAITFYA